MKKVALVTAGNKGIGRGIVLKLAKEGYRVTMFPQSASMSGTMMQ